MHHDLSQSPIEWVLRKTSPRTTKQEILQKSDLPDSSDGKIYVPQMIQLANRPKRNGYYFYLFSYSG
jgi:hypothetical protein